MDYKDILLSILAIGFILLFTNRQFIDLINKSNRHTLIYLFNKDGIITKYILIPVFTLIGTFLAFLFGYYGLYYIFPFLRCL